MFLETKETTRTKIIPYFKNHYESLQKVTFNNGKNKKKTNLKLI